MLSDDGISDQNARCFERPSVIFPGVVSQLTVRFQARVLALAVLFGKLWKEAGTIFFRHQEEHALAYLGTFSLNTGKKLLAIFVSVGRTDENEARQSVLLQFGVCPLFFLLFSLYKHTHRYSLHTRETF